MSSSKTRVNLHTTDGLNMSNARICFKREGGARGSGWRSAYYIKCSLLKQSLVHDKYSLPVSVNKTNVYHIMQFSDIFGQAGDIMEYRKSYTSRESFAPS